MDFRLKGERTRLVNLYNLTSPLGRKTANIKEEGNKEQMVKRGEESVKEQKQEKQSEGGKEQQEQGDKDKTGGGVQARRHRIYRVEHLGGMVGAHKCNDDG
eukprot:16451547-Heterocapsa_arctica.AAC.1